MMFCKKEKKKKTAYIQKRASKTTFADWAKIFGMPDGDETNEKWIKKEITADRSKTDGPVKNVKCLWDLSIFTTDV
jgi:hypothetical protein